MSQQSQKQVPNSESGRPTFYDRVTVLAKSVIRNPKSDLEKSEAETAMLWAMQMNRATGEVQIIPGIVRCKWCTARIGHERFFTNGHEITMVDLQPQQLLSDTICLECLDVERNKLIAKT